MTKTEAHMTRIGSGYFFTPSDAAMTQEHLSDFLKARGASDEDLPYFLGEYAGKTENEMESIYDELCGPMA